MLLLLVVLPFWTSLLLRVYAWIGLMKANGVINNVLMWLGVIHEPLTILYTPLVLHAVTEVVPMLGSIVRKSAETAIGEQVSGIVKHLFKRFREPEVVAATTLIERIERP